MKPLFAHHADATLERVQATYQERGDQYGDTLKDCQWLKLRAVGRRFGIEIPPDLALALGVAAWCDVKYQRNQGGYKDDSIIDGIAYDAVLAGVVAEMDKKVTPPTPSGCAARASSARARSPRGQSPTRPPRA
jgi:hypothetical protein